MDTRYALVMGFYFLIITHCGADYTITGCSSDNYVDVREDTGTTVTCDGINETEDHNIYWALSNSRIGDCTFDLNCTLTDSSTTDYNLTRPTEARSELRVQGNYRQKAGKTITCSRRLNQTAASCKINVIYPGLPTLPSLTVDGNATWTVNGFYRVHKMYSSRNKYSCLWIMENDTQHEINTETVTPDLSMVHESDQEFYNGTCSFSWPLPTDEGRYTINLTVVPGEANTSYSVDTFVIEHPADPEIQCVHQTAVEKETYICQCRASNKQPGKPAPSMSWPGFSNTSELRLVNVSRALNGTRLTCQLTWGPNASVVKTVGSTLLVTYAGSETSTDQAKSMAAIGGGVGAAVAVIVIIIIAALVIVYQRRQKTFDRPKVRKNEATHPHMDLTPSVTASTSDLSRPEYNKTNIAMGQNCTQEQGINTYEQPSPRRNEDTYLYTDLTRSVTYSAPDDASRDYRGSSIGAGQGPPKNQKLIRTNSRVREEARITTSTQI